MSELSDEALFLSFLLPHIGLIRQWEIAQSPHNDGCNEDDSSHFLQILFSFLPCMTPYSLPCWEAIRRQLHDKRGVLTFHKEAGEDPTHDDRHQNTNDIE